MELDEYSILEFVNLKIIFIRHGCVIVCDLRFTEWSRGQEKVKMIRYYVKRASLSHLLTPSQGYI